MNKDDLKKVLVAVVSIALFIFLFFVFFYVFVFVVIIALIYLLYRKITQKRNCHKKGDKIIIDMEDD